LTLGRWIGLLSLVVSLYVLWQIRAIVLLFFMAIIFAVGLNRVVRQFQKSRLKRSAAIAYLAHLPSRGIKTTSINACFHSGLAYF